MREIDLNAAARALASGGFNFLRRGADLSLRMSGARWQLTERTAEALVFRPLAPSGATLPEEMTLALAEIERITWDRLPRQQQRSQVRFHLQSGELWTFSGRLDEGLLD
jgi:hypothetical protein